MKNFIWAKTLLETYKYLRRVIGSIDRLVVNSGVHSYSVRQYESTLDKMEAIIDLIQRKKHLLAIKSMIEEGVKNLEPEQSKLLVLRYFDGIPCGELAEDLEIPRRTLHRKINEALLDFMDKLWGLGYSVSTIEYLVEEENWILGVYNSYVAKYRNRDKTLVPFLLSKTGRLDKIINSIYY